MAQVFKDSFHIVHNIVVRVANDPKSQRSKFLLPLLILYHSIRNPVHIPIYFNNNGLFRTVKIHNIRANAMLSAEFQGMELPGPQSSPTPIFSRRHLGAKTTSQAPLLGISLKNSVHRDLPHLPSPYKGEESLSAKCVTPFNPFLSTIHAAFRSSSSSNLPTRLGEDSFFYKMSVSNPVCRSRFYGDVPGTSTGVPLIVMLTWPFNEAGRT